MIFSYLLFSYVFIFINGNEHYDIGIINHNTQWHVRCPQNNTRIINPPLNDQPLVSYQCPYPSSSIDIIPIETDFTFLCRFQSRLLWIIVDLYQYNAWLWPINVQKFNISITLNQIVQIRDFKSDTTNFTNRFIIINAFYIPFESIETLLSKKVEILIQINTCSFYINENSTWSDVIYKDCHSIESKTLHVQYSYCDFIPRLIPITTYNELQIEISNETTTVIPDFSIILSIDEEQRPNESTTRPVDYHVLFDEHYRKILSALLMIRKTSYLTRYIFIFTIIILIILISLFIYTLCYHYHIRSMRKASLMI